MRSRGFAIGQARCIVHRANSPPAPILPAKRRQGGTPLNQTIAYKALESKHVSDQLEAKNQ